MASSLALHLTKWILELSSRLIKARVRLHNVEAIDSDASIIFVANHFTRLETILLPWLIHQHTGLTPGSLADASLFQGRIGSYLKAMGSISTENPDRDTLIIRTLLRGDHPWIIFPEGGMVKDKKALSSQGDFEIFDGNRKRPPHSGAAALALRAAYYQSKLKCLHHREKEEDLTKALQKFDMTDAVDVTGRKILLVPVNITYYPIRARENIFLKAARLMAPDLSSRSLSELSVEGTVLAEDTDIDIRFGEPIEVIRYLETPEYASFMACSLNDLESLETNPKKMLQDVARQITNRYMEEIYKNTTINLDHILAEIIRQQPDDRILSERAYRERAYLCAHKIINSECQVHPDLADQCQRLIYDEPHEAFTSFMDMAVGTGFISPEKKGFKRCPRHIMPMPTFHEMPKDATPEVIANEFEAVRNIPFSVRRIAFAPNFLIKAALRRHLVRLDRREFEEDYARFYEPAECKPPWVGRPFLLRPWRIRGGVVLAHGYMAAPLEIRALAEHLCRAGYAVYGVRLKGHGTAPEDLEQRHWEDWYASLNRGYAVMRTITNHVVLGGFSTGGCLALLAGAYKPAQIKAVFTICAPLHIKSYSIRLVPSIITVNTLLKRFGQQQYAKDYVENNPENKHINYTRNPLRGVRQLTEIMNVAAETLPLVQQPTLVIQASKDTTVDPASGTQIFEGLGTSDKQLTLFERARHGIINGEGSPEVFTQVEQFLHRTHKQAQSQQYWQFGRRVGRLFSGKNSEKEKPREETPEAVPEELSEEEKENY
ncbi:MAG: alpha/beta fold hydrolase [Candidatus Hydrogenedens sp.]|jgi:esterase/lipase/1-acyl-sn-glycerol-3-phosphate acyltransferase|nr:alpha/beta fold hydrolase [Candidatus Hydrogenedens sp.]